MITNVRPKRQNPPHISVNNIERNNIFYSSGYLNSDNSFCEVCQGKCYNPHDNAATQAAVRKMFDGRLCHRCINDENGKPNCPAVRGY